ncbi:hypothetical protein ACJIZ3_007427 [Penstemon smallii]|uniref:TF-B3 domain-containing protein n=1 Tax=Penstemon smallii TaxID=265156 RepID=A0ABD3SAK0_9LAMI
MASSSSSTTSCFQCRHFSSNPDHFRNGWRFRSGNYAQLCPRCASVYEEGRFCETFHSRDDGWRDCETCGKLVHCGCIVSFYTHLLLDHGGVICMECSRRKILMARNRSLSLEHEIKAGDPYPDSSGQALSENRYRPRVTEFKQHIAFFPDISGLHGLRIKIHDTEGNEWDFNYRCRLNSGNWIYYLEGLRDYMVSNKWQQGDTVAFYRVEPGGKMVIGFRRTSASQQLTKIPG